MSNLSIRARLTLLVTMFSLIAVALSAMSIVNLSEVRDQIGQLMDVRSEARRAAYMLSRNLEAVNAEQNAALSTTNPDELTQRFEEQDHLFKELDDEAKTIDKLLSDEERTHYSDFQARLTEYRRTDAQLRKILQGREAEIASERYRKEAATLILKIREVIAGPVSEAKVRGDGAKESDSERASVQGSTLAKEVLVSVLAIDDLLGNEVLETNAGRMEELSRNIEVMLSRLPAQLDVLQSSDSGARMGRRLAPLTDQYVRVVGDIEAGTKVNNKVRATELAVKCDVLVRAARAAAERLSASAVHDMVAGRKEVDSMSARAQVLQIALSLIGILGGALFAIFTVRRIAGGVEVVNRVAAEVADSSSQLRQATQAMSQRSAEEASSLEETSSTMEQMTATVEQNRGGAVKARDLAEKTREAAKKGAVVAGQAADAMRSLKEAGSRISDITQTVGEIAFQTNILALNASVEAARAGEHGRGFTVVASEVRTLAQRSAVSAREIAELIKESLQRIERGADLVAQSSGEMNNIVEGSKEVTSLVASIAAAAEEQATGIGQVSAAVLQLNQVVQANSAQAEEMTATAENLDVQGQELRRAVASISGESNDGHGRAPWTRPVAPPSFDSDIMLPNLQKSVSAAQASAAQDGPAKMGDEPIHSNGHSKEFHTF